MPYIEKEDRKNYDLIIEKLADEIHFHNDDPESVAGVLNYCTTQLFAEVFKRLTKKTRYWHIALICGILDNVKDEFYRRKASIYEDLKIKENGDVSAYE